jgi:hypothetical protein
MITGFTSSVADYDEPEILPVVHGARLEVEIEVRVRNGEEGIIRKSEWILLCDASMVGMRQLPCATITCPECRKAIYAQS